MKELYTFDNCFKRIQEKYENSDRRGNKFGCDRPRILLEARETLIINFGKICSDLNRDKSLVKSFVEKDLDLKKNPPRISGKDDEILTINGRYTQDNIMNVIKKFMDKYVICPAKCGSGDTDIVKKERLVFLECSKCGASSCIS